MIRNSLLFLCLLLAAGTFAQTQNYEYDWAIPARAYEVPEDLKADKEISLHRQQVFNYFYNEKGELMEEIIFHDVSQVNTDDAIEENNRIYLSVDPNSTLLVQKARVINPDGSVNEMNEKDVLESKDEESGETYKYFALSGLVPGSQIEYFHVIHRNPNVTGKTIYLQKEQAVCDLDFKVLTPWVLKFDAWLLNTDDTLTVYADTLAERRVIQYTTDRLPALLSEENAFYNPHRVQVTFKLNQNLSTGKKDLINYGDVASNAYNLYFKEAEKADKKIVQKIVSEAKISKSADEETRIRQLESYLKSRFNVINNGHPILSDLSSVSESNLCNTKGITKLFCYAFQQMGIEYQIVYTSDRSTLTFTDQFESFDRLEETMIYLPSLDTYIAPDATLKVLGIPPDTWTNTYGLFIKKTSLSNFESAIGKIRWIEALPKEATRDNMYVTAEVDTDAELIRIDLKKESTGYYASYTQPVFPFLDENGSDELKKEIVQFMGDDIKVIEYDVQNTERGDFGTKPLVATAKLESEELLTNAGNKYLVHIGQMIGPQMEMYQETERKLPVEQEFLRYYHRELELVIPEGYKVSGLDDLNMDIRHDFEGKEACVFTSSYTLDGNKVKVVIEEYYCQLDFPVEFFPQYAEVINAAADFNKIVLVLEAL